jgi:hypothetical protein
MECRDRIGTKRISNMDTDYRSDSCRPHLLTASRHAVSQQCTHKGGNKHPTATLSRIRTPLVRALALHGVSG